MGYDALPTYVLPEVQRATLWEIIKTKQKNQQKKSSVLVCTLFV
jgi:hypothetical protein